MGLLFSRQCEYALQAVLYLAKKPGENAVPIREFTDNLNIPYHFLGKILQSLSNKGLLRSHKGRAGGFSLGKTPDQITLLQIIEAIDGTELSYSCSLGYGKCSDENPCALHNEWVMFREGLYNVVARKNIAQLAEESSTDISQSVL